MIITVFNNPRNGAAMLYCCLAVASPLNKQSQCKARENSEQALELCHRFEGGLYLETKK